MKLWLISQTANNEYDTWDSAVVAAETETDARMTHPNGRPWDGKRDSNYDGWCSAEDVAVEYIGETERPAGVVLASFNAG